MVDLLYCEFLKLKHSKMFFISIMGAFVAPLMVFVGWMKLKIEQTGTVVTYDMLFSDTNLYTMLLFGIIVYCVIAAYLFSHEYTENTLKNILTVPVSKTKFILAKFIMLYFWIIGLTLITWATTLLLGIVGSADGFSRVAIISSFIEFIIGASLLFLSLTPFVFVTLWFKNIVPTIIFSAAATMINIALANDELAALFPWSAPQIIASGINISKYPLILSYISILIISVIGFAASMIYFKKQDIK